MDYDVSKAFKRIENDLIKSMMRNLDKHRAEETAEGINWSQWQAEQLKDLERYRKENAKRFPEQFAEINKKIDELYRQTAHDAQLKEEEKILEQVKKGKFKPPEDSVSFFGVNDNKLTALIESTHADFIRAEYAVLRQANDQYRKIIFDAQMYASTGVGYKEATNIAVKDLIKAGVADEELKRVGITYEQAIDMSTKELLKAGIRPVVYKNGSRHALSDYAEMAIRTGQKRAYLMGEGNAHDKYGIHTVMVKKRPNACPLCLPFGGKVLVDDVYGGGTAQEARELKVPTLSQAIAQGFLHPNCKDIYSLYIEGVSRPAERWTQEEVDDIVDNYNQEQELNHARDMEESYSRMAEYSLDPTNKQTYEARAKQWSDRVDELEHGEEPTVEEPKTEIKAQNDFGTYTQNEKDAVEYYVSGDGMWINQYLRGNGDFGELSASEKDYLNDLLQATSKEIPKGFNDNKLYRSVDASVLFKGAGIKEKDFDLVYDLLKYPNDKDLAKYAQKQGLYDLKDKPIGLTYTEKGFMSTTTDYGIASEFNDMTGATRPIVLKFDTSEAENLLGADAREFDIEEDPQKEILLHPDTRYTVENIHLEESEEYGRILVADAKLIGVEDAEIAEIVAEPQKTVEYNSNTVSTQYKDNAPMNEHEYWGTQENVRQRFNDIQTASGFNDEKTKEVLDAFCGNAEEWNYDYNNTPQGWFYRADERIRDWNNTEWEKQADLIDDYIVASPKYKGDIWRGLALDQRVIDEFEIGGTFKETGRLSSWTSDKSIANMFAKGRSEELGKIPVIIKTTDPEYGVPVSHLSVFGNDEKEVLVSNMHGADYEIAQINKSNGIVEIILKRGSV